MFYCQVSSNSVLNYGAKYCSINNYLYLRKRDRQSANQGLSSALIKGSIDSLLRQGYGDPHSASMSSSREEGRI